MNLYLALYLIGCALVPLLILLKLGLFAVINWVTKGNTLSKNLRKILPRDKTPRGERITFWVTRIVLEPLLSWINVVLVLWQIIQGLADVFRNLLVQEPEVVRKLRFPLKNNPNMSRESVAAHVLALRVHVGQGVLDKDTLASRLEEVSQEYPSFDKAKALRELETLGALPRDLISAASSRFAQEPKDNASI